MRRFDIVKKYLQFVPDFDIYKYCPSYFGLDDRNKYNYKECGSDCPPCKECWSEESEVNNEILLEFVKKLYENNKIKIKKLHEKESELLKTMQELCPHKNIEEMEDFYMDYAKCKDCGKIIE